MHQERKNNLIRVRHMLDFAVKAVAFTRDKDRTDLDQDEIRALALAHLVEMMGRAAAAVTAEFQDKYQEIPWAQIAAAGKRLTPGDGEVDLDMVWAITSRDLPPLISRLKRMIRAEG